LIETGSGTLIVAITGEPDPDPVRDLGNDLAGDVRRGDPVRGLPADGSRLLADRRLLLFPVFDPCCSVRIDRTSVKPAPVRIMRNATVTDLLPLRVYGHSGPCYHLKLARMFGDLYIGTIRR